MSATNENQDSGLNEQDIANIAVYHQRTLWNEAITKDYLTPEQVAELYHVNVSSAYRWIKEGVAGGRQSMRR